ncbi:hypothetical protein [Armatimonas sp.]|nr:hypothetical protein [Armatimonas sp.]
MRDKWDTAFAILVAVALGIFFGQPLGRPTLKGRTAQVQARQ